MGSFRTGRRRLSPGLEPGFFLTVARLLPYKHVDRIVEAFRGVRRVGSSSSVPGRSSDTAPRRPPANVTLLGEVDDARLRWLYANCAGLVAASREDFGLTPVEAAAFGKPVAALRRGGFLDTVQEGTSGVFFASTDPAAIASAIDKLERCSWDFEAIRRHAETFDETRFIKDIRAIVNQVAAD